MSHAPVRLADLRSELEEAGLILETVGTGNPLLTGASQDSRALERGEIFLAWAGTEFDANGAVGLAAERGASAAVVERADPAAGIPQLVVADGRRAAALAAHCVYGAPSRELSVVGITGTNGKTTTAVLTRALLAEAMPAAAIGTLGMIGAAGVVVPGTEGLTTPGPVQLARWLRSLADEGVRAVAMEVSSHALAQHRVDGVRFAVAVFTNISRDHLDYHPTVEAYVAAKARLASLVGEGGTVVVHADEPAWRGTVEGARLVRFSCKTGADLRAADLHMDAQGSRFSLEWSGARVPVILPLLGQFNVENALGAASAALALGMDLEAVAAGLGRAPQVAGRLERVAVDPCTVLIDYAHTPAALERVLETLRPLSAGRLIVLFGAGGDRDPGKRPHMGAAAARRADLVVVTSDNPRTEDPDRIIDDIMPGLQGVAYERITDRRVAIERALDLARPGDLVLLAGKGHEQYQVIGKTRRPFDERRIVLEHLASSAS